MSDEIEKRLAEIEARATAAMAGPWRAPGEGRHYSIIATTKQGIDRAAIAVARSIGWNENDYDGLHKSDARFIAHAREDVPWLVQQVRTQAAEIERLKKVLRLWNALVEMLVSEGYLIKG